MHSPVEKEFCEKIGVPLPTVSLLERIRRRFAERNPRNLYYRTCDATQKKILSQYNQEAPFPVYDAAAWWSDDFDATQYGRDFDFTQPFFEQFQKLKNSTPHLTLFNTSGTIENSDYNNCTAYLKNCYLIAESDYCEQCYYSNLLKKCTSVMDCSVCYESELCYESVDCKNCYSLFYSQDCQNCRDSFFLESCIGCNNCIGCINQRQKQYMIFNKQYSQEEYEKMQDSFELDTKEGVQKLAQKSQEFFQTQPHRNLVAEQNQDSAGDHLFNSKNAFYCFDSVGLEDCIYCQKLSLGVKSSMDYNSWGNNAELMYQCSSCGDNCYNLKFCVNCQSNMSDCEYCVECFSCSDCFGCVSLKKKRFCIFNKQYTESEYHELKARIIEHMRNTKEYGEFFPIALCPFGYNETMAMDTFPLTKEEAQKKGYKWYEEKAAQSKQEDPANGIFLCECGKNFKIIDQEKSFYEKSHIPNPEKCPSCRHKTRMAKRRPLQLWTRPCMECSASMQTSYSPERKEKVICESCYLKSVY